MNNFMNLDIQAELLRMKKKAELASIRDMNIASSGSKEAALSRIAKADKSKIAVLRSVHAFASVSEEHLMFAAQNMEDVFLHKKDIVYHQGDVGDSFYVVHSGVLTCTFKANPGDTSETPEIIRRLDKDASFGEISLLTMQPRSETVTVTSDATHLLCLKKDKFDELMALSDQLLADVRLKISRDVVAKIPLMQGLTAAAKKKILETMQHTYLPPNTRIIKQGTFGNFFYILTEGVCKVTLNKESGGEKLLMTLRPGDFFGEVAMLDRTKTASANVTTVSSVTLMMIGHAEFETQMRAVKSTLMQISAGRQRSNNDYSTRVTKQKKDTKNEMEVTKRRMSSMDEDGNVDPGLSEGLVRRFTRFMVESLWCSLYFRLYREMLIKPSKVIECGDSASQIMYSCSDRETAVAAIRTKICEILQAEPFRRSPSDHNLIIGLLHLKNKLKDVLCKGWKSFHYSDLCRKVRFLRVAPLHKLYEAETRGSTAFLIMRGSVRTFSKDLNKDLRFEEDFMAGDVFGEIVFTGELTRPVTAVATSACDIAVIDADDFCSAQEGGRAKKKCPLKTEWLSLKRSLCSATGTSTVLSVWRSCCNKKRWREGWCWFGGGRSRADSYFYAAAASTSRLVSSTAPEW